MILLKNKYLKNKNISMNLYICRQKLLCDYLEVQFNE